MIESHVKDFIVAITANEKCSWYHIIDRLPPHSGYPEAIDDGKQLDHLIRYFLPYVKHNLPKYGKVLLYVLYNPLNIACR